MSETTIRKLEHSRVEFAYNCASAGKEIMKGKTLESIFYKDDKYKSYVQKLPMLIKNNGLAPSIAFYYSNRRKDKKAGFEENPRNAYDLIYKQLVDWLKQEPNILIAERLNNGEDLLKVLISINSSEYRSLNHEVLALVKWVKRFAEGLIEEE